MANDFELIKAALLAEGVKLRKVGDKWDALRVPTRIPGLAPSRPIHIGQVGPKPSGSPGRGSGKWGYNLEVKLDMPKKDYTLVYDNVKTILEHTPGIDVTLPITSQSLSALQLAVKTINSVHEEFLAFRKYGDWAPLAFCQVVLKRKVSAYRKKYGIKTRVRYQKQKDGRNAQVEAQAPVGEPAIAAPNPPAPEDEPAPEHEPEPEREPEPEPELEPAATAEPIRGTAQREDNEGEFFDLGVIGEHDTTMADSSIFVLDVGRNPNQTVNMSVDQHQDEDDGGVFDMSQVTGRPLVLPQQTIRAPPPPPRTSAPLSTTSSALTGVSISIRPTGTSTALASNDYTTGTLVALHASAPVDKICAILPEPGPSPPPSPPPSPTNTIPAETTTRASLPPSSAPASSPPVSNPAPTTTRASRSKAAKNVPVPPVDSTSSVTADVTSPTNTPAPTSAPSAPFAAPTSGPEGGVIWRGMPISAAAVKQLRTFAVRQANNEKPRVPERYQDLVDLWSVDPDYDPSSEPDPLPVAAVTSRGGGRGSGRGGRGGRGGARGGARGKGAASDPTPLAANPRPKPSPTMRPPPESDSEPGLDPELGSEDELISHNDGAIDEFGSSAQAGTSKRAGETGKAGTSKQTKKAATTKKGKAVAEGERNDQRKEVVEGEHGAAAKGAQHKQATTQDTRRSTRKKK